MLDVSLELFLYLKPLCSFQLKGIDPRGKKLEVTSLLIWRPSFYEPGRWMCGTTYTYSNFVTAADMKIAMREQKELDYTTVSFSASL